MNTTTLQTSLAALLKDLRLVRTEAVAVLDQLEDQGLVDGPVILDGTRNEELKQTVDALRNDMEVGIAAVRRALGTVAQLEGVAQRYTAKGISQPILVPPVPIPAQVDAPG